LKIKLNYILGKFTFFLRNFKKNIKKIGRSKYNILILLEIYLTITVLLFYFGPIDYPNVNVSKTVTLIVLYNIFFIVGYVLAEKKFVVNKRNINDPFFIMRIIFICGSMLSIFFSYAFFVRYSNSLNPLTIFDNIFTGISNPAEAYHRNMQINNNGGLITKLMTLLSPLTYLAIPLGLFYFKKIKGIEKILLFLVILLEMFAFIIKGTNFGIFKVAIIIFIIQLLKRDKKINLDINTKKKISYISISIICFALFYFLYSISDRMGLSQIPNSVFGIKVNKSHLLFTLLPISLSAPLMLAISYISQGYYGLSLTTLYHFQTTFGFGSGRFLINNAQSFFHENLWERTYQYKMDLVWNSRVNWHTIYVWFANDVGLYGVIVIMLILGFLFSMILKDARENNSISAIMLLPLYTIMLIFIPANNIVFDNPLIFMPFVILHLFWLFSRKWGVKR
jgi:hypothetical protein